MDFSKLNGLVPAVVQDAESQEVLMVGFMNEDALARTRDTGFVTFFSRSRNELWTKGETSGNRLQVISLFTDCDDDTVLVKVKRLGDGNVCHTGARFGRSWWPTPALPERRVREPRRRSNSARTVSELNVARSWTLRTSSRLKPWL